MSSAEFSEWMAFAAVEPFGGPIDDLRFGTLAAASVAPWGGKTRPGEFFQWFKGDPGGDWRDVQASFVSNERAAKQAG